MSTADDLGYDPDLEPDEQADEKARKQAAFARRQQEREAERARLADAEAKVASYERRDALDAAKAELKAEGPLGTFLRIYDGEPTADAIRKAVENDPDFKTLVTFPPDERDVNAAEQARNARNLAGGGEPAGGREVTPDDIKTWNRERIQAFRANHPKEWDRLLAGQTVTLAATD